MNKSIKDKAESTIYGVIVPYCMSRIHAELIIDALQEHMDQYMSLSVNDFYRICGILETDFKDDYRGWTNKTVPFSIKRYHNGPYVIRPDINPTFL